LDRRQELPVGMLLPAENPSAHLADHSGWPFLSESFADQRSAVPVPQAVPSLVRRNVIQSLNKMDHRTRRRASLMTLDKFACRHGGAVAGLNVVRRAFLPDPLSVRW
jgi:hypothetical protein